MAKRLTVSLTPGWWLAAVLGLVLVGALLALGGHWQRWSAYLEEEAAAELAGQEATLRETVVARQRASVDAAIGRLAAGEKPDPVTFVYTVNGGKLMAGARRQVTLGAAWSGVLEVLDQQAVTPMDDKAHTAQVAISGLGGSVVIANGGAPEPFGTWAHFRYVKWDPEDPDPTWDIFLPFTITAQVSMDIDSAFCWYYSGEYMGQVDRLLPDPPGGPIVDDLTVTAAAQLTNVYLRGYRSEHPPSSRATMDWSDLRGNEEWFGDATSTITVTATGPGGISLSANGNFGGYGGETALGPNPFLFAFGFTVNSLPIQNTIYARVSAPAFNGMGINLGNLDLWYSDSDQPANRAPDQSQKRWSRFEEDAGAAKVHVLNSGGAAIRREAAGGAPMPLGWTGSSRAPYRVTFVPQP